MAGGGPRGSTRWSPARWWPASSLKRIAGRRKLRAVLLLNEGAQEGLKRIGRQCGVQVHRERCSATTGRRAEVRHLIPLDNSSTCQILSAGRQELPSPATSVPATPERGIRVKLAMDG